MLKNLLQPAKELLRQQGVESAALDAELLMAHTLSTSREKIILYPERVLSLDEESEFNELVKRRAAREPMAHILGKREFWGREFKVTKHTLDPRPDSETLIEAAISIYKTEPKPLKILDFGTGTGCLLLTLLAEFPEAKGTGVDISEDALKVAKANSVDLGLANRGDFIVSMWGEKVTGKYDLIISNPPYIKSSDIDGLEPEVAKYEPKTALDGGAGGLECYKDLAPFIDSFLSDTGFAILELGIGQDNDVKSIFEDIGLEFVAFKQDLAGINRCIIIRKII